MEGASGYYTEASSGYSSDFSTEVRFVSASGTASPRSRPMRADARRNYERLLRAARRTFAEQGAEASLEEVARRAEVGVGTLYRHFPNRLTLFEAVYRDSVDSLEASAEKLQASESPWEALQQWLGEFVDFAATKRAMVHELMDAIGKDSELATHSRAIINGNVETLLKRAQDAGEVRTDVSGSDLIRLVGGCTMMPTFEPGQQQRMLQVVLDGIRLR